MISQIEPIFKEMGLKAVDFILHESHMDRELTLVVKFNIKHQPLDYNDFVDQILEKDNILKRYYDLQNQQEEFEMLKNNNKMLLELIKDLKSKYEPNATDA